MAVVGWERMAVGGWREHGCERVGERMAVVGWERMAVGGWGSMAVGGCCWESHLSQVRQSVAKLTFHTGPVCNYTDLHQP